MLKQPAAKRCRRRPGSTAMLLVITSSANNSYILAILNFRKAPLLRSQSHGTPLCYQPPPTADTVCLSPIRPIY
ncbi:uncharacterized protein BDZ99DRAFT_468322 [Mytilinidion resinicola]|uniref:Uncharacterized protein n=1 Tax=Mytilinidion resinicola TaxID=574789 RepID=A0A6A6Y5R1_9PEZI|nr:uncharacterized protein BDZ99DRAFT_468322 [Mytilinidion resinicola]KAF2803364.1 hypothetical protein BDZ99DRAFT_468322 [Mytilinidion resinicola]